MEQKQITNKEEDFILECGLEEWREKKPQRELTYEQEEYIIESGIERARGLDDD